MLTPAVEYVHLQIVQLYRDEATTKVCENEATYHLIERQVLQRNRSGGFARAETEDP